MTASTSPTTTQRDPVTLVLAAWLVPGLGHYLLGDRTRGLRLGSLILGTFLIGLLLSNFEAVAPRLYKISFYAQLGVGAPAVVLYLADPAAKIVQQEQSSVDIPRGVPRRVDLGILFCNIAGILNILICFDLLERRLGPPDPSRPKGSTP